MSCTIQAGAGRAVPPQLLSPEDGRWLSEHRGKVPCIVMGIERFVYKAFQKTIDL